MRSNIVVDEPLEVELEETVDNEENLETIEETTFEMPSKFAEKSSEEIAQSYLELEKELGRKGNEIGELRKLTDTYIKRELDRPVASAPKEEAVKADFDFDNANTSVDKLIESNSRIKDLEERLNQTETQGQLNQFKERHPDYLEIAADTDFQGWITGSDYRVKMYARADQLNDFETADELLGMWKEHKSLAELSKKKEVKKVKRNKDLNDAATTLSSTGATSDRIFRRADLIKLRIEDPNRYESLSEEIRTAYAEGRVR